MGTMSYAEQLKHPNWQRKRLEVLEAANFSCMSCGANDRTLHAHHRRYVKGRKAWEYEASELQALCESCHADQHQQRELLDQLLMTGDVGRDNVELAVGMLAGYQWILGGLNHDLDLAHFRSGPFNEEFFIGALAGLFAHLDHGHLHQMASTIDKTKLSPWEAQFIDWLSVMANAEG